MKIHFYYTLALLVILSLVTLTISISFGSVAIPEHTILTSIWGTHHHSINSTIIDSVRLPRTLNVFITGCLLAFAGCLMQTLLNNPLADPYTLGISGGSAVCALIAISLGFSMSHLYSMTLIGGLITMGMIFKLSYQNRLFNHYRLLLIGVMFSALCSALISLFMILNNTANLRSALFWLLGDITLHSISWISIAVLLACFVALYPLHRSLDTLQYGELKAHSLGISTKYLYILLYVVSAILTATAVSLSGCIGFIGLITPHIIRRLGFYRHQALIPFSILLGGNILCYADLLARTIIPPIQLPIGIITAFVGVPFFLTLMRKNNVTN